MKVAAVIAVLLALAVLGTRAAADDVIYAVPNGDWRLDLQEFAPHAIRGPDGRPVSGPVVSFAEALESARPGATIQLLPGLYEQGDSGTSFPGSGEPDRPITLRGMGSDTVIGRIKKAPGFSLFGLTIVWNEDEESGLLDPEFLGGPNCLQIEDKEWIVLDNLTFLNCNAAVYVVNSRFITLKDSTVIKGLHAFFAKEPRTHHLLVEGNHWIQDVSEQMWHRRHWCYYKYDSEGKAQAGALFAAVDIAGGVIIRGNRVDHAFNAIRTDISTLRRIDPDWRGRLNTNVEVYDNEFSFIRDNVLEPEFDATNWWFHNNRIRNAHAWFSFDGLHGGRWYVYENLGWFDDKPSRRCGEDDECRKWQEEYPDWCGDLHDAGRVFKFRSDGNYAPGPLYVFNNSWYLRSSLIKDGHLGHIGHWNNAVGFCRPEDYPDGLCERVKPYFNGFRWDGEGFAFANDLSNHPDFPDKLRSDGYRVQGIAVPPEQPLFVAAHQGDLRLRDGSPGRGAGCVISLDETGTMSCHTPTDGEARPDIGASGTISRNPSISFLHHGGAPYAEAPRIVRVDLPGTGTEDGLHVRHVRIGFSVPIDVMSPDVRVDLSYGADHPTVRSEPCLVSARMLTCGFADELSVAPLMELQLPDSIVGKNGEPATVWGSVSKLISIRR